MIEVWLDGLLADTFGNEDIVIDKVINDWGEVASRNSDASNTFDLPFTNPNKAIFENAHVIISGGDKQYKRIICTIKEDGNVILNGFAILESIKDVFRISCFGGNADWFTLVGDKKISELNLDEFNHYFALPVFAVQRLNTNWEDGTNYPNVDYGEFLLSGAPSFTQFRCGVYYKMLVEKIFNEVNFNPAGDFWDNNIFFEKQFIPFCSNWVRDRKYSQRNSGSWDTPVSTYDPAITAFHAVLTNTITSTAYNILNPYNSDGRLVILDNCELTFRVQISLKNFAGIASDAGFAIHYIDVNGADTTELIVDGATNGANFAPNEIRNFDFTLTKDISQCEIKFTWLMLNNSDTSLLSFQFDILDYVVDESQSDYLEIDTTFNWVTPASTLPDIAQKDLLLTMFNQYCLMVDTDDQTNFVNLFGFQEVMNNIPIAKNWSNKIDLTEKADIRFTLGKYGQKNIFKYINDPADIYLFPDPTYGQGSIDIDNENLETEVIVFESVFSLVKWIMTFQDTITWAYIPKFDAGMNPLNSTPRVAIIDFNNLNNVNVSGLNEAVQPNLIPFDLFFNTIGGGAAQTGLLDLHYPALRNILQNTKFVAQLFRLKSIDVNNFDHSIPVWVDEFQAYFYVNKIPQYKITKNESTIVELIKIG